MIPRSAKNYSNMHIYPYIISTKNVEYTMNDINGINLIKCSFLLFFIIVVKYTNILFTIFINFECTVQYH